MSDSSAAEGRRQVLHIARLRVPLYEVDLGGGVYHGNYFHLFELAREEFFRELDYPYTLFMKQQLHLAVAEISCSFHRPLFYDDLLEVHTAIPERRIRSISFLQTIYRDDGNKGKTVCTQAKLNMVCIRFTGLSAVLPADFVKLLDDRVQNYIIDKTVNDDLLQ